MRESLLEYLVCPVCHHDLDLRVFSTWRGPGGRGREPSAARLDCRGCRRWFPVIRGIPRLLAEDLRETMFRYHPQFFIKHAREFPELSGRTGPGAGGGDGATRRTMRTFSYQWRVWRMMRGEWEMNFLDYTLPLVDRDFFAGRFGLDAGCGMGRHLYHASARGARMIGMDLGEAVESAQANCPEADLVQASIYQPPFRPRSFDFAYSIGVLHHLPDPPGGFRTLAGLVRSGGQIFTWTYFRAGSGRHIRVYQAMRRLSTRMNLEALYYVCLGLALLQKGVLFNAHRVLSAVGLAEIAARVPFVTRYIVKYPLGVLHNDWFDNLSVPIINWYDREEILDWYRACGMQAKTPDLWEGKTLGLVP